MNYISGPSPLKVVSISVPPNSSSALNLNKKGPPPCHLILFTMTRVSEPYTDPAGSGT
jgi:hypothetical protein